MNYPKASEWKFKNYDDTSNLHFFIIKLSRMETPLNKIRYVLNRFKLQWHRQTDGFKLEASFFSSGLKTTSV